MIKYRHARNRWQYQIGNCILPHALVGRIALMYQPAYEFLPTSQLIRPMIAYWYTAGVFLGPPGKSTNHVSEISLLFLLFFLNPYMTSLSLAASRVACLPILHLIFLLLFSTLSIPSALPLCASRLLPLLVPSLLAVARWCLYLSDLVQTLPLWPFVCV